jgi:hypothetical protein
MRHACWLHGSEPRGYLGKKQGIEAPGILPRRRVRDRDLCVGLDCSERETNQPAPPDRRGKARHTPHSSSSPPPSSSFAQPRRKQALSPRPPRLLSTAIKYQPPVRSETGAVNSRRWTRTGAPRRAKAKGGGDRRGEVSGGRRGQLASRLPSAAVPLALRFWIPDHAAFFPLYGRSGVSEAKHAGTEARSPFLYPREVARRRGGEGTGSLRVAFDGTGRVEPFAYLACRIRLDTYSVSTFCRF